MFGELLLRPYWLNTARFYGGNATGSDLFVLSGGIRELLLEHGTRQMHIAAWTLVTDGVFQSRPIEAAAVIDALCSDAGAAVLLEAARRNEISPLPELPSAPTQNPTRIRMTNAIDAAPADPENATRVRILRELLSQRGEFARWWAEHAAAAIGSSTEPAWLQLAAQCEAAAGLHLDLDGVDLTGVGAQRVLNSGIVPPTGGRLEQNLIAAVLDGQCPHTRSARSLPAQVAVALNPSAYDATSETGFTGLSPADARRRQDAVAALRRAHSPYAATAAHRRFKSGQRGSTFPWANTVTALHNQVGRCWLASELAVIGAATTHRDGWTKIGNAAAFGPSAHPAVLLIESRAHKGDLTWWRNQQSLLHDELAVAEWAFALWAVAADAVLASLLNEWETAVRQLSASRSRALRLAIDHLNATQDAAQRSAASRATAVIHNLSPAERFTATPVPILQEHGEPELLAGIARTAKWFKVDADATYR